MFILFILFILFIPHNSVAAPLSLAEIAGVMLLWAVETARPPSASKTRCSLRCLGDTGKR